MPAFTRWFEDKNIVLLDHPPNNPDLNPIENVWGLLVRLIYDNDKKYNSVAEQKSSIKEKWELIDQKYIQKLGLLMKDIIKQVLMKKGGVTDN